MVITVCVVGMVALCILLAWVEHRTRMGEAIERAVLIQRHRFAGYLRAQSAIAEQLSECAILGTRGQQEEAYASAVLSGLADQVAFGAAEVGAEIGDIRTLAAEGKAQP